MVDDDDDEYDSLVSGKWMKLVKNWTKTSGTNKIISTEVKTRLEWTR